MPAQGTTVGDVVRRLRTDVGDSQQNPRFSDARLVSLVFDALRAVRSARPEARYSGLTLVPDEYPSATESSTAADVAAWMALPLGIDPRWERAVRLHAESNLLKTLSSDSSSDARAQARLAEYNAAVAI